MTNLYCARCGTPTIPGERFCGECGNDLTQPGGVTAAPSNNASRPPTAPPYQAQSGFGPPPQPGFPAYQSQSVVTTTRRGGPSIAIIAAIIVVLAVAVVGGVFLLNNKGNNTTLVGAATPTLPVVAANLTPTAPDVAATPPSDTPVLSATTPAAGSTPNDPALVKEVNDAVTGMRALDSYHAKITGSYNGSDLLLDGDFSKQASQFSFTANGRTYNAIFVGTAEYVSADGGKSWQANQSFDSIKSLTSLFDNNVLTASSQLSDMGSETLAQGANAHKLFINDTASQDKITLWLVSDSNGKLIYRLQGVNSSSDTSYDLTIDYSNFNAPLNIKAPPTGN